MVNNLISLLGHAVYGEYQPQNNKNTHKNENELREGASRYSFATSIKIPFIDLVLCDFL